MNAAGVLLAAFGPDRDHRKPLWPEDLAGMSVITPEKSLARSRRQLARRYKIPLALFRKLYGEEITPGHGPRRISTSAATTRPIPHYGAWSPVGTPKPDFHRPEFFGELVFGAGPDERRSR